jgi:hypothetical protein
LRNSLAQEVCAEHLVEAEATIAAVRMLLAGFQGLPLCGNKGHGL